MTTPAPHPQRCETCENLCDWKGAHSDIGETVHEIMGKYGCASHSSVQSRDQVLEYLRSLGWMVAVHNDYKQNGEFYTFWLLTHPDGTYFKGEGKTDKEALDQIAESLRTQGSRDP